MYPEICKIGPFTIYSYGLALVVAFLISSWLACRQANRTGLDPDAVFNLLFSVFIFGIIGARLFYILENVGYYIAHPFEVFMLQRGGLAWFGGLFLGTVTALTYIRARRLPVLKTLDTIIPFVALGQAIGRLGCFLNGCCYGKVSSFGIFFPVHGATLIPTQLYSAFLLLCIYVILRFLQEQPHREGSIFFTYLMLYSLKRFAIEFWRADNPKVFIGLTLFQLLSIFVFCVSIVFFLKLAKSKK